MIVYTHITFNDYNGGCYYRIEYDGIYHVS